MRRCPYVARTPPLLHGHAAAVGSRRVKGEATRYHPIRQGLFLLPDLVSRELFMLYLYLWSFAFALALVPAAVMLRVISFPALSPRPVAIEIDRA